MPAQDTRTIVSLFEETCRTYADKIAYTCLGQDLRFSQLDELSQVFARYLQHTLGLKAGDRIAIQLPNLLQYPVVFYGAMRAGLIVVNVNPLYTPRELKYQLRDSGAKVLVVLASLSNTAFSIIDETSIEQVIITRIPDLHSWPKKLLMGCYLTLKGLNPKITNQHFIEFSHVLAEGKKTPALASSSLKASDVAVLQYTGGTTGISKGAMLTHHNLVMNQVQAIHHLGKLLSKGTECFIAPLPLYHIYALMLHGLVLFTTGNRNVLIPNPRDLGSVVKAMKSVKFTGFIGLNTLFNSLCHYDKFHHLDFSSLTIVASGGMALKPDVGRAWQKITGIVINEGYGLTETSPLVSFSPEDKIIPGTVGTPLIYTELKVTDENGESLPNGEHGELWIRGPQVMKGYWGNPEATKEVLNEEGWLKSGDMAVIRDDGYFQIVDRKKDMILVSGFNVYPNEIEDVVVDHPGVLDAAVVGLPSDKTGEAVKLFVVKKDPLLTEKQIVELCRANLAAYKVPHFIEFVTELPRSNVGKVLRRELRDRELNARAGKETG